MGKTSFALSIAKNIAVDYQTPIAFFSLEMNNVQLVNRLISNVCEIEGKKIMNGQLARDEWERLDKNLARRRAHYSLWTTRRACRSLSCAPRHVAWCARRA